MKLAAINCVLFVETINRIPHVFGLGRTHISQIALPNKKLKCSNTCRLCFRNFFHVYTFCRLTLRINSVLQIRYTKHFMCSICFCYYMLRFIAVRQVILVDPYMGICNNMTLVLGALNGMKLRLFVKFHQY